MEGTMEKTNKMLAFLHPIIEQADPKLEDFLIRCVISCKTKESYSYDKRGWVPRFLKSVLSYAAIFREAPDWSVVMTQ